MKLSVAFLFLAVSASGQIGAINTFPGGTDGQLQYNNRGRFGGVSGISSNTVSALSASTAAIAAGSATTYVTITGDTMTGDLSGKSISLTGGISASTATITYVQASSITLTATGDRSIYMQSAGTVGGTMQSGSPGNDAYWRFFDTTQSQYFGMLQGTGCGAGNLSIYNTACRVKFTQGGFVGIGTTDNPATKLHMSSGTLLLNGTDNKLKLSGASGVASANSGFLDLTDAGYGGFGTENWVGGVSAGIVGYNATSTHRFYNGTAGPGSMDVTATNVSMYGSTMTVAVTGIVTVGKSLVAVGSVTANAFFGNGSQLTDIPSAEGNTYTSSKTFTSDVKIAGVIEYAGVVVSTTGMRIYASSQTLATLIDTQAITSTVNRACVQMSTLTITTTARSCIEYTVNAGWYNSSGGATAYYNLLINGAREASDDGGASSDSSYTGHDAFNANYGNSANMTLTTDSLAPGTYTLCLAVRTNTGTLTFPGTRHSKYRIREVDCP